MNLDDPPSPLPPTTMTNHPTTIDNQLAEAVSNTLLLSPVQLQLPGPAWPTSWRWPTSCSRRGTTRSKWRRRCGQLTHSYHCALALTSPPSPSSPHWSPPRSLLLGLSSILPWWAKAMLAALISSTSGFKVINPQSWLLLNQRPPAPYDYTDTHFYHLTSFSIMDSFSCVPLSLPLPSLLNSSRTSLPARGSDPVLM